MNVLRRPLFRQTGGMVHDERTIRNVDDEIYRIAPKTYERGAMGRNARDEYERDLREKRYLHHQMNRMANGGPISPMPMMAAPPMAAPPMAAPPMAAPPMAAPPMGASPEAQVQMTEQMSSQEGEMLGMEYLNEMMAGIDTADSTDELIDSIRGNDRTLQERYDELAGYVGERDASATPESVLALVQPTIMLTEQGAMDSGIGELMQGITGEVDMETEMGVPTPMGQGLGELMVSESVEEVIPQMNVGGPIQYFQNGLEVRDPYQTYMDQLQSFTPESTRDQFEQTVRGRLPIYRELLGDTEQTRQDIRSKLAFDIAQAGLNLASGTNPRTGESMAGGSLASQIATAAGPVAASAGQAATELRRTEQIPALAALQSAEASESARMNAAQAQALANLAGGLGGVERGEVFGQEREMLELSQEYLTATRLDTQEWEWGMRESSEQHQTRLQDSELIVRKYLANEDNVALMNRLTERGILDLSMIDARGNWQIDIQDAAAVDQLLRDTNLRGHELDLLTRRINAEVNLRNLQDAAQMDRQMKLQEHQATEGVFTRTMQIGLARDRLNENKRQFDDNLGRLEELDKWNKKFDKKQLREMARQREATVGGYGTSSLSWVPVIGGWLEDSAFEFNQDQRLFLQEQQMIGMDLQQQEFDFLKQYRQGQNWISARNNELQSQWRMGQIDQQRYDSTLDALINMQTNYGELFGGSKEGIMQGLLTNQALLDSYADGTLDANGTNMVNTILIQLSTPYSKWDPADGTVTYYTPGANLPNAIMEALNTREQNGLPAPIGAKRSGLNIPGMQAGGDPGWAAFRERITPRDPDMIEPIPGGGAIVDETLSFEQASGPPRAWKGTINVIGDTVRDITGVGGPPYSEIDKVGEQLTAVANQTQRFIRDSVAGRPFAIEIEQMAEEIAKPGVFRMDEQNLIKLQTMRSQLKEIQSIATSILERPQGFDRKTIVAARQDLTQIAPLIENYDRIIRSYERDLGKIDKPDPALFERSPYNAQGRAPAAGDVSASPVAGYAAGSIMGPPPGFEDKNMTLLGYDTGVPSSAIMANAQGMALPRTREELENMKGIDTRYLGTGITPFLPEAKGFDTSGILANQGGPITRRRN